LQAARTDNSDVLPNKNCSSYEAEVARCRVALLMVRRVGSRLLKIMKNARTLK
jgi:hypothetical protein